MSRATISVQVVYASAARSWLRDVVLPDGASVADAIEASGLRGMVPDLQLDSALVGVFGQRVALESILRDGDRVELYRPLLCDPKEVRRRRAQRQRDSG